MAALELKEKGNAAFKAKRFIEALQLYKQALAADPSLIALHNNLSAASFQLGNFEDAKRHAREGLELEPTSKGYARLGAAHWALAEWVDAAVVYEKALALNPGDAELSDALTTVRELARGRRRGPAAGPSSSSSSSSSAPPPSSSPSLAGQQQQQRRPAAAGGGGDLVSAALDAALVVMALLHVAALLPSPGLAMTFWRGALMAMAARQVVILRPTAQPTMGFVKTLPTSFPGLYLLLSLALFFLAAPPLHLLLAAMAIYAAVDLATAQRPIVLARVPAALHARVVPQLDRAAAGRQQLLANAATCEVVMGIMGPLSGAGALVTLALWYFLKFRYLSDGYTQLAFRAVAAGVGRLCYHPRCPAVVGSLFTKLQAALHRMAVGA